MKNVVLTCYFTGQKDWQRDKHWEADYSALIPLINSIDDGVEIVIFHDCFNEVVDARNIKHIKVPPISHSASFNRWIHYADYLKAHPEIERVWCCDSTDVVMVNNPFPHMNPDAIYSGDECTVVGNAWMRSNHSDPTMRGFIEAHNSLKLLNAGLLGGTRQKVIEVVDKIVSFYFERLQEKATASYAVNMYSDMGVYNHTLRTNYPRHIIHGRQVCTGFKRYEDTNGCISWWKHK